MSEAGHGAEKTEIANVAKALERVEKSKTKEEVKKSGVLGRLKRLLADLNDKDSKVYKATNGIKHAAVIIQSIASGYAAIAQWAGLL